MSEYVYTTNRHGVRIRVDENWQRRDSADSGTGTGLSGAYFSDTTLSTQVFTRTDSLIDFDWALGSPDTAVPDDGFSVRWSGLVQPRSAEPYTFTTTADDGVRLWVNDELVIDDWTTHTSADIHQGVTSAALTAGQPYTLTLEYFEDTDTAEVQLEWESIQQLREIVPTSQLYPRFPTTLVPSTPLTNTRVLTYTYDGLQRLTETQEVGPTTTTAYSSTYDLAGNRLEAWTNGVLIQNHSYDAANQVSGWSYDAAGNLTSDGTTTSTYDALNRLTVQGITNNAYNGDGVLVAQTTGSATISYTQDLIAPLSQILSDGTSQYVYGRDRLFGVAGGTRTWYLGDALGSVRQTFDDAGLVQQALRYDAWGVPQGSSIAPFGYTGELQQGNQVYLRARWYNSANGAFGSRDPFAGMAEMPYSLHSYQYGYSVPTMWTDPSGRITATGDELGDGDSRPCAIAGQSRDEAGRCIYYKEWVDANTLTGIVVGGPVSVPNLDTPLIFAPPPPPQRQPGFDAAQRRSDPFILTNPTTPDGLLVFTAPLQVAKDVVFDDCNILDGMFPGYLTNSGSNSRNLTPEEEILVSEAKAAYRRIAGRVTDDAAIAEVAGKRVHSGWKPLNGYEQKTDEVLERANEIGYSLPTDRRDRERSGRFAASHAEKQAYEVAPGKPIGVSRRMCGAGESECWGYFRALSTYYQQTNVVADPYTVYVFRPDGAVIVKPNDSRKP